MVRSLSAEEAALWRKVVESVRPLAGDGARRRVQLPSPSVTAVTARAAPAASPTEPRPRATTPGTTLDGTWDRRLARGQVHPDMTLDLHGHNLATAYHLLDRKLEQAIATGARTLLLITGKPRSAGGSKRGAIRAAVGDWLGASRHAGEIAAIRNAHPRQGGSGALYIILRRQRPRQSG